MKKFPALLLALTLLMSVCTTGIVANAAGSVTLNYPGEKTSISPSDDMPVKGSISGTYDVGSAKVLIDGVSVKQLEDGLTTVDAVIDSAALAGFDYGEHTVVLEASFDSQKVQASKTVYFAPMNDTVLVPENFEGYTGLNKTLNSGVIYDISSTLSSTYTSTLSNGTVTIVKKDNTSSDTDAPLYFSMNTCAENLKTGKVRISTKFKVSNTSYNLRYEAQNSEGKAAILNYIIENGKFVGSGETVSPKEEYKLDIIIDFDAKRYSYIINDKPVVNYSNSFYNARTLDYLKNTAFRWYAGGAATDESITFWDFSITHSTYLPIDSVGEFVIDDMTASVTVTKASVSSSYPDTAVFMIAGYAGNELVAVKTKSVSIAEGENNFSVSLDDANGATRFEAFLWYGIDDNINPVK